MVVVLLLLLLLVVVLLLVLMLPHKECLGQHRQYVPSFFDCRDNVTLRMPAHCKVENCATCQHTYYHSNEECQKNES